MSKPRTRPAFTLFFPLAALLAAEALKYASEQGLKIIASCSYMERFMARQVHAE